MSHENPASGRRINIEERRGVAVALRKQGASYREIAKQINSMEQYKPADGDYSVSMAYGDVMHELKRIRAENAEEAGEALQLELDRLDTMQSKLWPNALKGDYAALDRILVIMDKRARYMNLAAPAKAEVSISGSIGLGAPAGGTRLTDEELKEEVERLQRIMTSLATLDGTAAQPFLQLQNHQQAQEVTEDDLPE
jgi:hypothetical protein